MKRSDAVKELAISLMSRLSEWEKTERLKFADSLLGDLEVIGMLPPSWIPKDNGYGEPNGFNIAVNEWEPEDEH